MSSSEPARLIVTKPTISQINGRHEAITANVKHGTAIEKAVAPNMLRANIVVAERLVYTVHAQNTNAEHHWSSIGIGHDQVHFNAQRGSQCNRNGRNGQTIGADRIELPLRIMIRKADGEIKLEGYVILPAGEIESCESEELRRKTTGDVVLLSLEDE